METKSNEAHATGRNHAIMNRVSQKHVMWISTLKGLSCLCIFAGHFFYAFATADVPWARIIYKQLLPFLLNGTFVVALFAFISGFFTKSAGSLAHSFKTILKRYLRFCLPLFAIMFLIWGSNLFVSYSANAMKAAELFGNKWIAAGTTSDLSFLDVVFESTIGVIFLGTNKFALPTWMIRPMFFAQALIIMYDFFVANSSRLKSRLVQWKRVDLILVGVGVSAMSYVMLSLILGYWFKLQTGDGLRCECTGNVKHIATKAVLSLVGTLLLGHVIQSSAGHFPRPLFLAIQVILVLVLFFALSLVPLKALDNAVGDKLGSLSFPIYLIHMPVIRVISSGIILHLFERQDLQLSLCVLNAFVVSSILILLLSLLWHSTVDRTIAFLLKKF